MTTNDSENKNFLGKKKYRYKCSYCGDTFLSFYHLWLHVEKHKAEIIRNSKEFERKEKIADKYFKREVVEE